MTEAQITGTKQPARSTPVRGKERLDFVDVLRGFALIGVLVANMPSFMEQAPGIRGYPGSLDLAVRVLIQFFIQTKFYHMFSFLFGWGMSMQLRRAEAKGTKFAPVFIRRLFILLIFGALHGVFIWTGDILLMYAFYGFLLLAFRKRSEKFILISMLVFLAYPLLRSLPIEPVRAFNEWYQHITAFLHFGNTPGDVLESGTYWQVTRQRFEEFAGRQALLGLAIGNIFGMFLLGLYVGKRRIFENVTRHFDLLRKVMWVGLGVGVIFNFIYTYLQLNPSFVPNDFVQLVYVGSYTIGAPFMMLFYVSGLTLLLHPESGYGKLVGFVQSRRTFFRRLLWVWVPLAGVFTYTYTRFRATFGNTRPALVGGALALVIVFDVLVLLLLFTLVFSNKIAWRNRFFPLRYVGRMALTNYLTQSVVNTLIFYGYGIGLYGEFGPTIGLVWSIVFYLAQLYFSEWWLERYQFGPMEYVWRTLTYGRRQPLRIGVTYADLESPQWVGRVRGWVASVPAVIKLALVWVLLVGWGAGLFYWNTRLTQREQMASFELLEEQPEVAESETASGSAAEQADVIVTPEVVQVAYRPGPVAASGDLRELAATFNGERALDVVDTLTHSPYLGRAAGSPQGQQAGDYIATQFAAYGLQPAGDDGSFFQAFPVSYARLEAVPTIAVTGHDGDVHDTYRLHQDFVPFVKGYAGSGAASGPVVWVNDCAPEDFNAADVFGKVALCHDDDPLGAGRHAMEYGAVGLLLLTDPDERPAEVGATYADVWVPVPIPVMRVYPSLVRDLLAGTGRTVPDLSITYLPFELQTRVEFEVQASLPEAVCPAEGCVARNVLGVIPGRDPAYADEVIIVGANYDQFGQSPDGSVWPGANDNASGVAVLLELARAWQEQGYVPGRTVVFAAWDANALGFLGSAYYVAHPQYAFENTVAAFQLEMAGAGSDTLFVDADTELLQAVAVAAGALDVPVEVAALSESDHTPFGEAGVPAALLTWYGDESVAYRSGQLGDTAGRLRVDKLQQYGEIVQLALLGFTEAETQVNAMLAERSGALQAGDLEGFLSTSSVDYAPFDRAWFADVQVLAPVSFEMHLLDLELGGEAALGTVQVKYALPPEVDGEEPDSHTEIMTVRFEHAPAGWQWAGPVLVPLAVEAELPEDAEAVEDEGAAESEEATPSANGGTASFTIYHSPDLEDDLTGWPQIIGERYAAIARDLGLPTEAQAQVWLFPGRKSLQLSMGLSDQGAVRSWVGDGVVKLVYDPELLEDPALDDALVQLALANAGVEADDAPWLWRGLPLVYRERQDFIGVQARYVPALTEAFAEGAEIDPETDLAAWAATEYARQQLGWDGLAEFVTALGEACQAGSCADFGENYAAEWQAYWQSRIDSAQATVDETLTQIENAVLAGDKNAYLQLVDADVPALQADAESWFAVFDEYEVERFTLAGSPVAFFDDGGILAAVSEEYALIDREDGNPVDEGLFAYRVWLSPADGGYLWAGAHQEQLGGETVTVMYPPEQRQLAEALQTEAVLIYARLAEYLQMEEASDSLEQERQLAPLVLKLYADRNEFYTAIPLSSDAESGVYSRVGESVRLFLADDTVEGYRAALADQLARNLLDQMGIESEWLLSGVAMHLSAQFDGGATQQAAGQYILRVRLAVEEGEYYDLRDLPSIDTLPEEEAGKVKAQAWDSVRYLVDRYGWDSLLALLQSQAGGSSLDQSVVAVLGIELDDFVDQWGDSLVRGHAAPEWIDTAMAFDPASAMAHIDALTTPEMAGREAGSEGAVLAAEYIAARFAEYGLLPVGDMLEAPPEVEDEEPQELDESDEEVTEPEAPFEEGPGYLQNFPIEYTELTRAPRFDIIDERGLIVDAFTYRQDFLSVLYDPKGASRIDGELVLVTDDAYTDMDLTGKIIVRDIGEDSLIAEMEKVIAHGGEGLILVGDEENPKVTYAKHPVPYASEDVETLPILELTQDGYTRLLAAVGLTQADFYQAPAALPLGARGLIQISLSEPQQVETANVLGFLPGSDPILGKEIIILGAHYDHSGNDPDMLVCSPGADAGTEAGCQIVPGSTYYGANDNASGVAVLLEIARLWHETGYQPKRSVLFAAWGAQELGQIGSTYYLENPVFPLSETVFMVQMDAIGGGSGHYLEAQGLWEQEGLLLFNLQTAEDLVDGRLKITVPSEQIGHSEQYTWIAPVVHRSPQSGISDQIVFREYGMPTLLTTWRGASEDNWPDEFADEVDPDRLGLSGRMLTVFMMMGAR